MMEANVDSVGEPLRIRKFEVGDLVFAKLKGYPPWPSKINQIESIISGGKEIIRYNIFFYGTHQSSICRSSVLYPYDTHAKAIVDKWGRKQKFHDALKELEREMMDKVTYLNQLRSTTPESSWCHGFSTACDDLVHDLVDKGQDRVNNKNHIKSKQDVIQNLEDEIINESRTTGYEVLYIERIPFPDTPESLIVLSLKYNPEWVEQEGKKIKEEERMMNCFVKIEPFPAKYAHLDPNQQTSVPIHHHPKIEKMDQHEAFISKGAFQSGTASSSISKDQKNGYDHQESMGRDVSDGSDELDVLETCPVCRLCFFTRADLRKHENSVHGNVSTAESLFDRLMSNVPTKRKGMSTLWKEGYALDRLL